MTLVLSMNPFLDPEGDPPPSAYQPVWESERCSKTCLSNPAPPCNSDEQFTQEPPCRRVPGHVSVSRIAYFKRKFVDDDDEPSFSFRTYCQTVAPVLEERAHVLRLSLEKMRFIDDPEAFLRRSVLVNNLLRRLRAEILLQSTDWCFPPNPAFATGPCVLPPGTNPAHQAIHGAVPRICLAPQAGPPFRKRLRMVRGGHGNLRPDCAQTCCCIYAAAASAGHYLHLPFSMYDAALSTCPSTPHSSSFFQLASHSKVGLTVAVEERDDEDEDVEEEEENEEEEEEEEDEEREEEEEDEEDEEEDNERRPGPSVDLAKDKSSQKRTRTLLGHPHTRTDEDTCMTDRVEDEEEGEQEEDEEEGEEEEEEQVTRPCQWVSERELHKVSFWHRRAHRQ
ncbi:SERTA domain-containing protein 4 [Limanda limanda]|uniref:SERTA domain-containing protein 4 n=1 Tax=Limanda limanda TaxID=27771 RepID=UPI0029C6EDD5|nr:SERTA domain-containing protein 4 [Limanda limanda]